MKKISRNREQRLKQLGTQLLQRRQLIVASNRGPFEYRRRGGNIVPIKTSGGLVTVLNPLTRFLPFTWISSANLDQPSTVSLMDHTNRALIYEDSMDLRLRYVRTPRNVYFQHYNVFSNPFLWFLQHSIWDLTYSPDIDASIYDAWEQGYIPMNKAFANLIVQEAEKGKYPPLIMLHDYHLYLTGGTVKKRLPASVVQHFIHIPWPTPQYFTIMPSAMRTAILESLCSCDIVGFQTGWDARNFLLCCESLLKGTKIDLESMSIDFNGHRVLIRQYPVSIDATTLVQFAASSEVLDYEKKLRSISTGKTIVRVDRLEPTKNIIRGFRAYELLLGRHPELIGKVTFLAFLVPSRTDIWEYQRYSAEVLAIIQRINSNFRRPDWQPIQLFHQENYAQAIAGMKLADVLVVNPLVDGMNLVAKEGPMVNNRHAALVLSERAGAHEQLGSHSLTVSPVDIEGTAKAIYAGLNLDVEERISRSDSLQGRIRNQDIIDWIERQLIDLLPLI